MQSSAVFATATSRLHADVIVIRLTKAGLPASKISAIYPERLKPNCADCWLKGRSVSATFGAESVVAAGPFAARVSLESEPALVRSFQAAGLPLDEAQTCAASLSRGHILIAAQAGSEEELSLIWHLLFELQAGDISVAHALKSPRGGWVKAKRPSLKKHRRARTPSLATR